MLKEEEVCSWQDGRRCEKAGLVIYTLHGQKYVEVGGILGCPPLQKNTLKVQTSISCLVLHDAVPAADVLTSSLAAPSPLLPLSSCALSSLEVHYCLAFIKKKKKKGQQRNIKDNFVREKSPRNYLSSPSVIASS